MNVLFITLLNIVNIDDHNIYSDLVRELAKNKNNTYVISPFERRYKQKTGLIDYKCNNDFHKYIHLIKIKIGNIQKTNILEKGISTILIENQITKAIKKYCKLIKFDLVIYSTPPITLIRPIKYIKERDNAKTYLMLKDIFPQNAVDLELMKRNSLLYKFFRKKEKKLYLLSDKIGCMSEANVKYILNNNKYLAIDKVEEFPNSIEPYDICLSENERIKIRNKYCLPKNKKIIVCGGNFGKPQNVPYIVNCIKSLNNYNNIHFAICGEGTDFCYFNEIKNNCNVTIIPLVTNNEFNKIVASCDFGLITLDYRFTIPNFPSRLLSYLLAKIPVIVCSDKISDIGAIAVKHKFGWCCASNSVNNFVELIKSKIIFDINVKGSNGYEYLNNLCNIKINVKKILQ